MANPILPKHNNTAGVVPAAGSLATNELAINTADAVAFVKHSDGTVKQIVDPSKAPLASPTLTGIPKAPTAPTGTNTTQLATTAFTVDAGIGGTQTWQDVTASRVVGTTYTNSTGRPIEVAVTYTNDTANKVTGLTINGVAVYASGVGTANAASGFSLVVPVGATYKTANNGGTLTLVSWVELR
jgi:hypothetical protein